MDQNQIPYPGIAHTIKDKKALLARVRRIQGQVAALERALEQDSDCSAVLQQIAAIRGAVNGLMAQVLEGHLREHLGTEDQTPEERRDNLKQVLSVLRSYLK
ncbi:Transcriptional repressor FrmR [Thiorhodovibrio winogradskyi]|uniref:Transcriptional repressor FrmR n=1 Tax=Thiorhodovibrio winogradskyi TaxID=77007 RepID=A0ABZ0S964_9GAMM